MVCKGSLVTLNESQLDLLELVYRGFTNKEIANEFGIEYGSAKVRVARTFHAIGVNNRWAAMAWYRKYLEHSERAKQLPTIHMINWYGLL